MRTERLHKTPSPKKNLQLSSNLIILSLMIFSLFACFALAGPMGFFTWISDFFNDLNADPVEGSVDGTPVLLGLYTSSSLQVTAWEIEEFDKWMAENNLDKGISIAGTYMDFEFHNPEYNVPNELNAAWDLGYVPFINITAYQRTAEEVATDPEFEERIRKWAQAFAEWSNGGEKRAFIAPLQEMNGGWVRYGLDPENFKAAWHKIRYIFAQEGVVDNAVSWVFAPNAWSEEGHEFEVYYPGDASVDVVAFSSMNFGRCVDYGSGWDTFESIYLPFLNRMREMAPGKPIFISQMGTVPVGPEGRDDKLKNEWLSDTFRELAAFPGVKGLLYFNVLKAEATVELCRPVDWRIYDGYSGLEYTGFLDAVESPQFAYWAPDSDEMIEIGFGRREGHFYADVWPSQPLAGTDNIWYYDWIEALSTAGLATGCRMETYSFLDVTLQQEFFCPSNPLTRAEAAVFLELALNGPGYWPPQAVGMFEDVPAYHWAAGWIEKLVNDGLSTGCGEGMFCPDEYVSRAQLAVLVGKAKYASQSISPGPPTGTLFSDVGAEDWGAEWIEELANEGIATGCKLGKYCPDEAVSRAEMAVLLVKAFNIPVFDEESWIPEG